MKFTKMHGLGNDYIYVNGAAERVEDRSALAVRLSDRHFGIGSDGLIFINPSDKADFEMEMYNSDGSRAEMCGNGIRCVAKYVFDNGLTDKKSLDIETLAGVKHIELMVDEASGRAEGARVNMGRPSAQPVDLPCDPSYFEGYTEGGVIGQSLEVRGKKWNVTCISVGNPHAVVFIDTPVRDFPLEEMGPLFENHPAFPARVNTEFVRILGDDTVEMRVWERGAGETLACGTGATAVAVACILRGFMKDRVRVKLLGGDLDIQWAGGEADAFMTGPATTVYTGEVVL